jgi:hypothetical protein
VRSALLFKYSLLLFNLDYCPIVFSNNLCEVKHFPRHKFYSAERSALIQKTFIKIFFYSRRQKKFDKILLQKRNYSFLMSESEDEDQNYFAATWEHMGELFFSTNLFSILPFSDMLQFIYSAVSLSRQ